ncbi:hypothetical protein CC85DRAFT_289039 [Cutaneotrichosporon oleaginosum]|uniref:Uncharacterized protein n=1 Tax=Cutaneotrichosporon oleaginosum TaxID=879819 RepID=A0A0J0XCX5_9TREE|nr:uncharacterized protein CC85DRAFT_289039 [Cutaneotrichosporon oleaginosum]KLT38912.1 hypothetical protein CC85DRAFT_289039 [Cutaneotrichosporon oleaginosum]TXT14724.1 hypothetical protein COLE_00917 [Cutaneotrichosporon oleaginosum]
MANLRPRTSILKRPGGVGVLSSVNDRGTMAGYGWVRLDTDDRASFESTYEYADSTNPPTYGEASHGGARTWTGPSDSSGASGGASTPAPGEGDATAFRVHGTIRNSGGFRKVRGARADAQSASQPGSERGHVLKLRLDPVLTNRAAPLSAGSPSTPTPQSPPTPRASHMSHMPSFRGGELHRYDTFGRRREDTPSTLFDVDDATVQTAIAGQRAGSAWAPTRV